MHRTSPLLVARESLLDQLRLAAVGAADGHGGTRSLIGPAGIGKSALARKFVAELAEATAVVGRAAPPPAEAMRALSEAAFAAIDSGAQPKAVEATIYGASLRTLIGGQPELAEASRQSLMLGEALRLLFATCPAQPVVCVLEDLHWADSETLAALDYLVDHVDDTSTLVVTTMRDHESETVTSLVRRWADRRVTETIAIPPLDRAGVDALISACLEAPPPSRFVDEVVDASEGNPFLVEEFLHEAITGGVLTQVGDDWQFVSAKGLAIPATFLQTVERRVSELPPRSKEIVQLCSLVGRDLDPMLLSRMGVEPEEAGAAIDAAMQLLLGGPGAGPSSPRRFRHALTQDAVAATVVGPDRQRIAAAALAVLEGDELDDRALEAASLLAQHSGATRRSCELLIEAATRAVAIGATSTALARLDAAEALVDADALHGNVIRECRVQALALAGEAREAIRIGEQLIADVEAARDRTRLHRVQLALARAHGSQGDWAEAAERLDRVWNDEHVAPADVLSFRAITAIELGDVDLASRLARDATERGTSAGVVMCEAHEVLGRVARERSYAEAATHFRAGVEAAGRHDLPLWRARSLLELGLCDATLYGRSATFEEAQRAATASGALSLSAMVDYNLANLHGLRFDPEAAVPIAERAVAASERLGAARLTGMGWIVLGQAHAVAGKRAKAGVAADRAQRAARGDVEIEGLAMGMCRGTAALIAEDRDAAVDNYQRCFELLLSLPFRTATSPWYLGPLLLTLHDPDGLSAELRNEASAPALRAAPLLALVNAVAAAVAAGRRGDAGEADRLFGSSFSTFERKHPELVESFGGISNLVMRLTAEAALADGWGQPVEWLTSAGRWFIATGHEPLARACTTMLREAGVAPRRRGRSRTDVPEELASVGVTARELDVLRLLQDHLTNRQIGERLTISPRTVKTHVEHLLTKTGRRNRIELAELARELGVG